MQNPTPIACRLSADDLKARLAAIAELNAKSIRSVVRDGLRLELVYDGNARRQVEDMVNRERECCAFLTFNIHERESQILVLVEAPEEAREAAESLFAQLGSRSSATPSS